jgi:uncharacterized protein (TIGR02265 family)
VITTPPPARARISLPPPSGTIQPVVPFEGDLDERAILAAFPREQSTKGMFFGRFVADLRGSWDRTARELVSPPLFGRYLPFSDYPLVDHLNLAFKSARKRFPGIGLREGIRRVARDDVKTFLGSVLGRISAAMLDEPGAALAAVPGVFERISSGPRYAVVRADARDVVLRLSDGHGPWEYVVGQLEGILLHYRAAPSLRCATEPGGVKRFEVRW